MTTVAAAVLIFIAWGAFRVVKANRDINRMVDEFNPENPPDMDALTVGDPS